MVKPIRYDILGRRPKKTARKKINQKIITFVFQKNYFNGLLFIF